MRRSDREEQRRIREAAGLGLVLSSPSECEVKAVDPRIQLVVEFMDSNVHKRIPLSELAEAANLSPYHLCRLFKKQTGVSTEKYLRALRMAKARRLLATQAQTA